MMKKITGSNSIYSGYLSLKRTLLFVVSAFLIFISCEGPEGPEGPIGPQGPAGSQGAAGTNGSNGTNGTNGTNGQNFTSNLFDFESFVTIPTAFSTTGSNVVPFITNNPHFNTDIEEYNEHKVESGDISDNQTSRLILSSRNYPAQSLVSFVASVDTELHFDFLLWYVDGQVVNGISGTGGPYTFQFLVPAGTHTVEWRYSKDISFSDGADAIRIDDILIEKWAASGKLRNPDLPETMNYWNERPANLQK